MDQDEKVKKGNENGKPSDEKLIVLALEGNETALEDLIQRHRSWIHDTALGMTRDPLTAEDVTQEVLLIILTRLSTFRGESSFRCWLHRIISNHVINLRKRKTRESCITFSQLGRLIDNGPLVDLSDPRSIPVDLPLLFEEVGAFCMMGMLLCLDLEQRLIFILGEIFEVNDWVGSEVFEISKVNYRKKLSRARKLVYGFVKERYGTADEKMPRNGVHSPKGASAGRNGDWKRYRPNNGNNGKGRYLFEETYHRFSAFFHTQFLRLTEDRSSRNSSGPIHLYREIVNSKELQRILRPVNY